MKAAQVRHMVPKVAALFKEFATPSAYDAFQQEMLNALAKVYDIMHTCGLVFSGPEYASFKKAALSFLCAYTTLSEEAKKTNLNRYNVVAKFHYFVHLVQQAEFLNPKASWCYGGEDLVGRASTLAQTCTRGTAAHKITKTMMDKYRVAVHLKWTRL